MLTWKKTSEGYEAIGTHGTYEPIRMKSGKFVLMIDGYANGMPTLLRDCKDRAQAIEDDRFCKAHSASYHATPEATTGIVVDMDSPPVDGQRRMDAVVTHPHPGITIAEVTICHQSPERKPALSLSQVLAKVAPKHSDAPHLSIIARAGTGKTTTLMGGIQVIKGDQPDITPSSQQAAIWDQMALSDPDGSVCITSFGNAIVDTLKERIESMGLSGRRVQAMTMHSMGYEAVRMEYGNVRLDNDRTARIIEEILLRPFNEVGAIAIVAKKLCNLAKLSLCNWNDDCLDAIAGHHDLDLEDDYGNDIGNDVFQLTRRVLTRSMDVKRDGSVDFSDMLWIPLVMQLQTRTWDNLLVDEAQDLNPSQHQLVLKAGRRIMMCGDDRQSLYGFSGADTSSMAHMEGSMFSMDQGCKRLPLTVTRRCGHNIVAEARKIVPDFEAHESCPVGMVTHTPFSSGWLNAVPDDAMIVCRLNAPLVSQCLRLLKDGRKASILGRDMAEGLLALIRRMKVSTTGELRCRVDRWEQKECAKELRKPRPNENRIQSIRDRAMCIIELCEGCTYTSEVADRLKNIFADSNAPGIRLSTIHKAKGLEAPYVAFLQPRGAECPLPWVRKAWQKEQEMNCKYVAITRAIEELCYVS